MNPPLKKQFSFTAQVTWQNGVFIRMATALARKGFDVIALKRRGAYAECRLVIVVEGPQEHINHALVVLQQLIDVTHVSLSKKQTIDRHTKNRRQKITPMVHQEQEVIGKRMA